MRTSLGGRLILHQPCDFLQAPDLIRDASFHCWGFPVGEIDAECSNAVSGGGSHARSLRAGVDLGQGEAVRIAGQSINHGESWLRVREGLAMTLFESVNFHHASSQIH